MLDLSCEQKNGTCEGLPDFASLRRSSCSSGIDEEEAHGERPEELADLLQTEHRTMEWRSRDETLFSFLQRFPSTCDQWVKAGIFRSLKVTQRRATKLQQRERKGIRYVGGVLLNQTGRKHNVYFNGRWKIQSLLHEVLLTEELLPFWRITQRGNKVGVLNSDAVIEVGDLRIHCEMDMDTEGAAIVQPQMDAYARAETYNVWFAPTKTRIDWLKRLGNDWSLYSVCGSNVWFDSADQVFDPAELIPNRCA